MRHDISSSYPSKFFSLSLIPYCPMALILWSRVGVIATGILAAMLPCLPSASLATGKLGTCNCNSSCNSSYCYHCQSSVDRCQWKGHWLHALQVSSGLWVVLWGDSLATTEVEASHITNLCRTTFLTVTQSGDSSYATTRNTTVY